MPDSFRRKISAFQKGKPKSVAHRESISCAMNRPEVRLKCSINAHWRGKTRSDEQKDNLSRAIKTAMHSPAVRQKHLDGLHASKWLKCRTDKGCAELLQKWDRLGFKFELNHQVRTGTELFYVDGYDREKNVVFEYDSPYHSKSAQVRKDLNRQHKIVEVLKPRAFWRYNSLSGVFSKVHTNL